MNPRLKLLIEDVRRTHIPLFIRPTYGTDKAEAYCYGCKGLEFDCPVLKAAKELEDDDQSNSS
jgi:hypothetical protein